MMEFNHLKLKILLGLLLANFTAFSQCDTIKMVSGTRIPAKILEVGDKQVSYKNPHDTLGPTHFIPLKMIASFVFKDGCYEPLNQMGYKNCAKDPLYGVIKNEDFTRHIIGMDFFQLLIQRMNASFEYIFKNRKAGLVLHCNLGMRDAEDTSTYLLPENKLLGNNYYKKNYYGVDFKFYPWLHKKITHWMSFGAEIGNAGFTYTRYDTAYPGGSLAVHSYYTLSNPRNVFKNAAYFGYHFNNGFLFRGSKHFILQGVISLGINQLQHDFKLPYMNSKYYLGLKIAVGLSMCYAF